MQQVLPGSKVKVLFAGSGRQAGHYAVIPKVSNACIVH